MRTYKLLSLGLLVFMTYIHAQAQTYTSTTVYTPANTPVNAWQLVSGEMTQDDKNDLKNNWLRYYNYRITYLGEATYTYNCHAYAWHVSEGGSNVWIGRNSSELDEEDKYWSDLSYVEVPNQAAATKVSFGIYNHSAITTTTTDYFISKWGDAPLFRHHKNDCPYNTQDLHYYAPLSISGPSVVCSSGGSFNINYLPTGTTITWSQGPNLTRTSAQGAHPCTFSSTGSGSSWIRAALVKGSNSITLPDKVVWLGIPQVSAYGNHIVDIQTGMPISDLCYGRANEAKAVHLAGEAYISDWDWRVSYGQVFPYGSNDQYATIYPNDYYSFMLEIRAGNACGYSGWAHMYTNVVDCRSYHLVFTPNPTIGETILSIESDSKEEAFDENAEWEMEIYSQSLLLMKKKTRQYGQSTRIQTADWKEGVYIVRVLYKGEVLTGKLMVTK
ncbi:MAG: T9SS type A sorting domain-containing protein [Bacteroidales bacterium]|jgi:hypothetical protein